MGFKYTPLNQLKEKENFATRSNVYKMFTEVFDKVCMTEGLKGDYEIKESTFTNKKGEELVSIVVRNGGEALKYTFNANATRFSTPIDVKYTTHYFMNGKYNNGQREWVNIDDTVMKPALEEVYKALPFEAEEQFKSMENYLRFKSLVTKSSPVTESKTGDISLYYVQSPVLKKNDKGVITGEIDFNLKKSDSREYVKISLNNDGTVKNIFVYDGNNCKGNINTKHISLLCIDDPILQRYTHNAVLMFNNLAKEVIVTYNDKESNQTHEKTFQSELEAQDFINRLPETRYDAYIMKEDEWTSMEQEDFEMEMV